jgi:transposase-like protein
MAKWKFALHAKRNQIYPTKGTIFEKTTTPLLYWFWAIYMFTTTRNGVAAKELERQFNICYKTALRMAHQIKILIAQRREMVMTGIVEADEAYLGGKIANKHAWQRALLKGQDNKATILALVERSGEIIAEVIPNSEANTILPIIRERVAEGAILVTDAHKAYKGISKDNIKHYIVNHDREEYARGILHTNSVEGFWAQVKRTIIGTHIHVSRKHLQKYLDECTFRYKMRDHQNEMFDSILSHVSPSA